jgi:hypothetical protein
MIAISIHITSICIEWICMYVMYVCNEAIKLQGIASTHLPELTTSEMMIKI